MNRNEAMRLNAQENALRRLGFSAAEAETLRRASMTLQRWNEHECNGVIQRDENTEAPYWHSPRTGERLSRVADREAGARRRIAAIQSQHPDVILYVQGDPRGCALYAVPLDVLGDSDIRSEYTCGVAIY